jgi:hypothetical protein
MKKWGGLRLLVGLALLLSATPRAVADVAASPLADRQFAPPVTEFRQSREQARSTMPGWAVDAYAADFEVPADIALERLATQNMAPGINLILELRLGNPIASVWFDNQSGEWVVAATDQVSSDEVRRVLAEYDLEDDFRYERVAFTQEELRDANIRLTDRLDVILDGKGWEVGISGPSLFVSLPDDLSPSENEHVEAEFQKIRDDGIPIEFERRDHSGDELGAWCLSPYCDTLMGGDFYSSTLNGQGCTMGFYGGMDGGASGVIDVMLTAGHCTDHMGGSMGSTPNPPATIVASRLGSWNPDVPIGRTYYGGYKNGHGDWGFVQPYVPSPTGFNPGRGAPYPGYVTWNGSAIVGLQGYYATGTPALGTYLCQNGATNLLNGYQGTECGALLIASEYYQPFDFSGMMRINGMVGCHGDSGGPIVLPGSRIAAGIFSTFTPFTSTSQCGDQQVWATPVSEPRQEGLLGLYLAP